ncbi:ISAs1 family transposase [Dysgonomonas reticulitermitis]
MESPLRYFSTLTDPRVERTREHDLEDILFIAIASIICGAEGWNEIEEFGKSKVTIDAMGCQKDIASKIIEKEADYLLALKGNQGNLLEQVEDSFRFLPIRDSNEELDSGHGRVETRRCLVIDDLSLIESKKEWEGLRTLVKIESERYIKSSGKTEKETRLYISSLVADAKLINQSIRAHWSVENSLHWVLDVGFNEDRSRKRTGFAAQNYSLLNRIALNLLKNDKITKVGVRGKRLKAGWDNNYLINLIKN